MSRRSIRRSCPGAAPHERSTPLTTHPTSEPAAHPPSGTEHPRPRRVDRAAPYLFAVVLGAFVTLAVASPADAATAAPSLTSVIGSLTDWLVGILAGLATLFLTLAGIRYLTAGGDPAQVERAKVALRSAMIGYALAALAPLLVSILQSVVSG